MAEQRTQLVEIEDKLEEDERKKIARWEISVYSLELLREYKHAKNCVERQWAKQRAQLKELENELWQIEDQKVRLEIGMSATSATSARHPRQHFSTSATIAMSARQHVSPSATRPCGTPASMQSPLGRT